MRGKILAHKDFDKDKEQLLAIHLFDTAEESKYIAEPIGLKFSAYLVGILHDIGKADPLFQEKIQEKPDIKVQHSAAGAKFLSEIFKSLIEKESLIKDKSNLEYLEVLMYVIEAHHGIFDIIAKDADYNIISIIHKRLNYDKDGIYKYAKVVDFVNSDIAPFLRVDDEKVTFEELLLKSFEEHEKVMCKLGFCKDKIRDYKKGEKDDKARRFYLAMEIRLLLSILKSADIKNTINAYEEVIIDEKSEVIRDRIERYVKRLEDIYSAYEKDINSASNINKARLKIADIALKRGIQDNSGIYKLDLPTGAGKTKASLRYALQQLKKGKSRLIYITAFLSVLEQNASEIRDILGDEGVIEHHSNMVDSDDYEDETKEALRKEYLKDTWDAQVVLSTMVQFFNTLLKGKSDNLRRFHSLINSVIILDEVQSLPVEVTYFFNLISNFLSSVMNCNLIMCTATQPLYDDSAVKYKMNYGGNSGEKTDVVELSDKDRKVFDRISARKLKDGENYVNLDEMLEIIREKNDESILVILNTKSVVADLHHKLEEEGISSYYLSTNLCAAHRKDIIREIKGKLKSKEPVICISTQLIEAGVDVDFNNVIRSYAGFDSIIQAAGRCNREGKYPNGDVILVNIADKIERTDKLKGIHDKKNVSRDILRDLHGLEVNFTELTNEFYKRYFANAAKDGSNKMEYPLEEKDEFTLLDYMIGDNIKRVKGNLRNHIKTVADRFELINETLGITVIVYYKDNEDKIERLIELTQKQRYEKNELIEIKKLLKELQRYTVNVLKDKVKSEIQSYMGGSINILTKEYYDEKLGVVDELRTSLIL